jgi:hypothetical protein
MAAMTHPSKLPVLAALALAAWLLAPSLGQAQSTRPAVWTEDQQVDLELGAFDDPFLTFALTRQLEPDRRLELFQPFDQQPPAALGDFSPTAPTAPPCIPGKLRVCP